MAQPRHLVGGHDREQYFRSPTIPGILDL